MTTHAFDETQHPRNPDGTFGSKPAGESDQTLDDLAAKIDPNVAAKTAAWREQMAAEKAAQLISDEQVEVSRQSINSAVHRYYHVHRGDQEYADRAADAMVSFYEAVDAAHAKNKPIASLSKYAATITANQAGAMWSGASNRRGPDMRAGSIFRIEKDTIETDRGYAMSEWEEAKLAQDISDRMVSSGEQAPLKNYHLTQRNRDILFSDLRGGSDDEDGAAVAERIIANREQENVVELAPAAGQLKVRRAKSVMNAGGGVRALSKTLLAGEGTAEQRKAILLPWNDELDPATEQVILESFSSFEGDRGARNATETWDQCAAKPDLADRYAQAARSKAREQHLIGEKVPPVTKRRMTSGSAARCRDLIVKAGGSAGAARSFNEGTLDDKTSAALLAPWGGADCRAKDASAIAAWLSQQSSDTCWNVHLNSITSEAVARPTKEASATP